MPKTTRRERKTKKNKITDKSIKQIVKVIVNEKSKRRKGTRRTKPNRSIEQPQQQQQPYLLRTPAPAPPSTSPEYLSKLNTIQERLIAQQQPRDAKADTRLIEIMRANNERLTERVEYLDDVSKTLRGMIERINTPASSPLKIEAQPRQATPPQTIEKRVDFLLSPTREQKRQLVDVLEDLDKSFLRFIYKKVMGTPAPPNENKRRSIDRLLRDENYPKSTEYFRDKGRLETDYEEYKTSTTRKRTPRVEEIEEIPPSSLEGDFILQTPPTTGERLEYKRTPLGSDKKIEGEKNKIRRIYDEVAEMTRMFEQEGLKVSYEDLNKMSRGVRGDETITRGQLKDLVGEEQYYEDYGARFGKTGTPKAREQLDDIYKTPSTEQIRALVGTTVDL